MTIVLAGGGSGGHITPILAIAAEIKRIRPNTKVIYIGQTGDLLGDIPAQDPNIDQVFSVRAGKFRRFHGEGLIQFLDIPTFLKNARDFFYVQIGIFQSWRLMKHIKPDVIFSRGGFVSVPVALGGHLNGVPYITHDSDPIPSLANRIIARWAALHAVALPKEMYPYPEQKTVTTGIPISEKFVAVTPKLKKEYRDVIKIPTDAKLLFIIGGGLGSQTVNSAVTEVVPHLLQEFNDLFVVHIAGGINEADVSATYKEKLSKKEQGRVEVYGFISDVYRYSGAADIIITRAGATNLAEFALQSKACIVIPSSFLTGGHQLKSAQYLADKNAALVMDEADLADDPNRLAKLLSTVLQNKNKQEQLSNELSKFGKVNATKEIAKLIIEIGAERETNKG